MHNGMNFRKIKFTRKEHPVGELSEQLHYECSFCSKTVKPSQENLEICKTIVPDKFYCPFCLRHGFYAKSRRDILILSFRSIISYYYDCYCNSTLYLSEVEDMILAHKEVGLENPLFTYDPETYLWFIDLFKVQEHHKINLKLVLKTVINILACFNLYEHLSEPEMALLFKEYRLAIENFETLNNEKIIPLFPGIVPSDYVDEMRNFTAKQLVLDH
jgi:hypothetical protein